MEPIITSLTRTPPRGSLEAKVEAEMVRATFRAASFSVYINLFVPLLTSAVLWPHYDHVTLVVWTVAGAVVAVARYLLNRNFFKTERPIEEMSRWANYFRIGVVASAAVWAYAAWAFLVIQEPVPRAFVIFVIAGINAGAARSLASLPLCYSPYGLICLLPVVVRFALDPHAGSWALALMTSLYLVFLVISARGQRLEMQRMYRTALENEALVADLREAKLRSEEANRVKSEFMSTISHEIHTPMHGVLGMLQLLEQTELDAEQRVQVGVALSSGNALHGLLRDVLDFSRIESGRLELAKVTYNFSDLMKETSAMLAAKAEEKGLQFKVSIGPELPVKVVGDPERLRQVLSNLILNAVKFTDQGWIELSVRPVVVKAGIVVVRFSIKDTGIGMSVETQERLFEKFMQANSSATRRHGGVGLGLAISQQLVWRMGGEIRVRSALGAGSEFFFEIPVARSHTDVIATRPSDDTPTELLAGHVLVVEDDLSNQQVAEMMLRRLGLTVDIAGTGEAAIALMKERSPDVVLMDMRLPGMDGLATTRIIRDMRLPVPIVALTANSSPQDRAACLDAGMDDFLGKPLQPNELHRCMQRWLRED